MSISNTSFLRILLGCVLPASLLAQAIPLQKGTYRSEGVPVSLTDQVHGSWTEAQVTFANRVLTAAQGAHWVEVIPSNASMLLLVERHTPLHAKGDTKIVYYRYRPVDDRLDTLYQFPLPFDGVLPLAHLDSQGEIVLLNVVEGWGRYADQVQQFAQTHQFERQGWILTNQEIPHFLWGPQAGKYTIQAFPYAGTAGSQVAAIPLDHITAISEGDGGRLAIAGYRTGDDAIAEHVLMIMDSLQAPTREYQLQVRKCTWIGEELLYADRLAAYRLRPDGAQEVVVWETAYKPVILGISGGSPLLLLSASARPTVDGWVHENVQILSGTDLAHEQKIVGPVLIIRHHQWLQVGDDFYPLRPEP